MSIKSFARDLLRKGKEMLARLSPRRVRSSAPAPGSGESFDIYIGPSGNDSNDGSIGSPKAITYLNNAAIGGLRVGLLDGTYDLLTAYPTYPAGFQQHILDIEPGDSGTPTVVKAVNRHAAILDARFPEVVQSPYPECSVIGCTSGGYVTIDGLKIINAGYRGIMVATGAGYIIQNCWVLDQIYNDPGGPVGANSCGINLLTAVSGALISNCRVEGSGAPSDNNRHACIQTFDTTDSIIEKCSLIVTSTGGNGIHFKNAGNKRNTVRNCYIDATAKGQNSTGILWHGNTDSDGVELCENNVIKAGFFLYSEGFANTMTIRNCTAYSVGAIETVGWFLADHTGTTNFYNNITYRTSAQYYGDVRIDSLASLGTWNYNLYADNSPDTIITNQDGDTGWTGLAAFFAASGKDGNSITVASPGIVASGSEAAYYQLDTGSDAIGAGKSDGTSGGSAVDMGAWGGATPPTQIGEG